MTDRVSLDELTSDALDQLYADLAEARAEQGRFRTMYDASEARVNDLIDERDKLDRQLTTMTDVAKGNKRHVQLIVPELEAAEVKLAAVREDRDRWRDQARTEQADRRDAEAAIERVKELAGSWRLGHYEGDLGPGWDSAAAALLAVLANPNITHYEIGLDHPATTGRVPLDAARSALDEHQEQT